MKKLIALFLCVWLTLSVAGIRAENADQAALRLAFAEKAQAFLAAAEDSGVSLTLAGAGTDGFEARLLPMRDADGSEMADLTLALPGLDAPLHAQFGPEAAWLAWQDRVYEISYEQWISDIARELRIGTTLREDAPVLGEILGLFARDVLLPGIALENGEEDNTLAVHVSLSARDLLRGLAAFGDHVLENARYRDVALRLARYIGIGVQGGSAADPETAWPQLREQLLAMESDLLLKADLLLRSGAYGTACTGQASLTLDGAALVLKLDHAPDPDGFHTVCEGLWSQAGEEYPLFALKLHGSMEAACCTADLSLPAARADVSLTFTLSDGSLQAHLTVLKDNEPYAAMNLSFVTARDALALNGVLTVDSDTTTFSLYGSENTQTFTLNNSGQTLRATLRTEEDGRFAASLSLPAGQGEYQLDGQATDSSLHAILTSVNPYASLRSRLDAGFSAELTAVWEDEDLSAQVTVNSSRQTAGALFQWSPNAGALTLLSEDLTLTLRLLRNTHGPLHRARLTVLQNGSGTDILYGADTGVILVRDEDQTITLQAAFQNEDEWLATLLRQPVGSGTAERYGLRLVLSEDSNTRYAACTLEMEEQAVLRAALVLSPVENPPEPLREASPVPLTWSDVRPVVEDLLRR